MTRDEKMVLARLIARARYGAGMSQEAFAKLAGCSIGTIMRLERGTHSVSPDMVRRAYAACATLVTLDNPELDMVAGL